MENMSIISEMLIDGMTYRCRLTDWLTVEIHRIARKIFFSNNQRAVSATIDLIFVFFMSPQLFIREFSTSTASSSSFLFLFYILLSIQRPKSSQNLFLLNSMIIFISSPHSCTAPKFVLPPTFVKSNSK